MGQSAPAAPDYAAANQAGVQAQLTALPLQLQVDRAAQLGTKYTDPTTGKVYDFSGMGDAQTNQIAIDSANKLMTSGADLQRQLTQGQYQDLLTMLPQYNALNLQSQKDAYSAALDASKEGTANQYQQDLQYMPQFGDLQRSEDAKTYAQNLALGQQGTRAMTDLQTELMPQINKSQLDAQTAAADASRAEELKLDPERVALQSQLGQTLLDNIKQPGLTDLQTTALQQQIRGAQAARGNILGEGAGYDESQQVQQAGESAAQGRQQLALQYLATPDNSPVNFQAAQTVNTLMPNYSTTQQPQTNVPNFQATTTSGPNLNPVSITGNQGLQFANPNAGQASTQFASNIYNTQSQYASQQGSPWMQGLSLATSAAGMAML